MKRYASTRTKVDKSGTTVYSTTFYPPIPIENNDQFIRSRVGDRLDFLAHSFYGDTTLWWVIAKANGIRGKVALEPGILLRIPGDVQKILEKFNELNR
tara:strand:- start:77 stop:370 length:294 start_codon:yes stop_codon:yes gene_type:complete